MGQFLRPSEHFDKLVEHLDNDRKTLYRELMNSRPEAAYRNRNFVIYEIVRRDPKVLDTITILDFVSDDEDGASCEVISKATGQRLVVSYSPVQLFDYEVFMHLPLHCKLRWSTTADRPLEGTLAFDVIIRTRSRLHMRERGVTYCEAGTSFAREFEGFQD